MARLTKAEPAERSDEKPTMLQLRQEVEDNFIQAGYDAGYVRYFMDEVCSPYNARYEQPHMAPVQGKDNATRWENPYRIRILECQRLYLQMSEQDRGLLHAGVQDGVRWRGEPIGQYVDIANETEIMRQTGRQAYVAKAKRNLDELTL